MTTQPITVQDLRPCLLVALDVSRTGGQSYTREDIQEDRTNGTLKATWTTKKVLDDETEYQAATKLQSSCKYAASKLGRHTPVGIVASVDRKEEVALFRDEWKRQIDEFNADSKHTRIGFTLLVFEIKGDNIQALETVLDDLREGLAALEKAYRDLDPKSIREVVQRMQGFTEILPERVGFLVDEAVKEARQKARSINKAEKDLTKIETKIAEVLGPERDVEDELRKLSAERLTTSIRLRTLKLKKLADAKRTAIDQIEETKQRINDTPIRLARFALTRTPRPTQNDQSADLLGAKTALRFAF